MNRRAHPHPPAGAAAAPSPGVIATAALSLISAAAAAAVGYLVGADQIPVWWVIAGLATAVVVVVLWPFDRGIPLLVIIAALPLFPVTTIGPYENALGGHGSELRAGLIVVMLLALLVAWRGRIPKPPPTVRPIVIGLLLLAGLGVIDAWANASTTQGFGSLLEQLLGQPLVFAGLLVFLCAWLSTGGRRARDSVLAAFSVGLVLEAGLIAAELISGGAVDELRGFTRAQGTVGANFVSAFAMMGFFIGLAERQRGSARGSSRLIWMGWATAVAAAFILVTAVARGGLIGLVLGALYLLLADPRLRRQAPLILSAAAVLFVLSLPTPVGGLWKDRLTADTVEQFDRPATWISGARIGLDHPLTGLGELEIVRALGDVREYRQTPLGETGVLPHNSWILVFAEGGFAALLLLGAITVLIVRAVRPPPAGRSSEERYYVAALIGIAAVSMINNVFRHPELMGVVLLLVSLISIRESRLGSSSVSS